MKFEVRLTKEANTDILRNMVWWAENHSARQAMDWEVAVRNQVKSLSVMPRRFGFAPENEKVEPELHQMLVGLGTRPTYRAIFTINDSTVFVLAVRRGAQDEFRPTTSGV